MVKNDNKNLHDAHKSFQVALVDMCHNAICLCLGCNEKPCMSHVIPQSTLRLLAEKGMVKVWRRKSSENLVKIRRTYTNFERMCQTEEPVDVPIGSEDIHDTVTYPLFCRKHDN